MIANRHARALLNFSFFEREKDLVETLKLLVSDNNRLNDKVEELKIEVIKKHFLFFI